MTSFPIACRAPIANRPQGGRVPSRLQRSKAMALRVDRPRALAPPG